MGIIKKFDAEFKSVEKKLLQKKLLAENFCSSNKSKKNSFICHFLADDFFRTSFLQLF
jgi:hypothetical protein